MENIKLKHVKINQKKKNYKKNILFLQKKAKKIQKTTFSCAKIPHNIVT